MNPSSQGSRLFNFRKENFSQIRAFFFASMNNFFLLRSFLLSKRKIFIIINTEEFSIVKVYYSIVVIVERVFLFSSRKRDLRQVYGVHVLGRKDKFPEVLHVQRVMTGSFLSLESARDRLARRVFLLLPVTGIRGGLLRSSHPPLAPFLRGKNETESFDEGLSTCALSFLRNVS